MKFSVWLLLALMSVVLSSSALAVSIPISVNTTNSTITISYEAFTTILNLTPDLNTTIQINYTNSSCTIYNNTTTTTVNIDYELIKAKTVCSLNYSLSCPEPSCPQASCPACPALDYAAIDNKVQERVSASSEQIVTSLSGKILEVNQSLTTSFTSKSFSFPDLTSLAPYAIGAAILAYALRKKWQPLLNKAAEASTTATNTGKEEAPK